ncbi:MAG TPA: Crp/Fnr family transcriptional regulator [Gemmatimonadaceae bacterium]|nr:Crp/Fnr family transcriptional regulator [Gemmatimonadaceae bacterium]
MREAARLSPAEREAIAAYGARTTWPAGFTIYERGARADGVFLVLGGLVVLRTQMSSGRCFVPWVANEGATFGGEGLEPRGCYATSARAEEVSETLHLGSSRFNALLREQPAHASALIRQVMAERTELLDRVAQQATLTVEQRLITALLRLTRSRQRRGGAPPVIPRRLLGELVGATRESISLVLGKLTGEGMVRRTGNGLIVTDVERLAGKLAERSRNARIEVFDDRRVAETHPSSPGG